MKRILIIDTNVIMNTETKSDPISGNNRVFFVPGAITNLSKIAADFDFYKILVNCEAQVASDGFLIKTLQGEGFVFEEVFPPVNTPGSAVLLPLLKEKEIDFENSFIISNDYKYLKSADALGCRKIYLSRQQLTEEQQQEVNGIVELETNTWTNIYSFLKLGLRKVEHQRYTNETKISISLNLDGNGKANINTGLGFFDHMLEQVARHGKCDLNLTTKGDLHIDEHHTIEDTGIALGEAFAKALSDKRGLERYGFALPMDEASAKVLIDFGGRNDIVWNASFKREKIGDMPTEMFYHFFKSFSDAAKCNLHIESTGENEHHKIEAIFKAFAKAIRMAVKRDPLSNYLPSTKGIL